jgi:predicted Zn-dependent peptidase
VIGTAEVISTVSRRAIRDYHRALYTPGNIVVAGAGNIEHDRLVALVEQSIEHRADLVAGKARTRPLLNKAPKPGLRFQRKDTEQYHVCLGAPGVSRSDPRRFAASILDAILGGSASSRLFQEIREKRGLAYSVYSYATSHADTGLFGVYAGCAPGRVAEVLQLCREQLALAADKGLTDDELRRSKGQMRGSLVLGLEDTGSRMSRLGKGELVYGEQLSVDDVLARIDAVTLDDVHEVARDILNRPLSLGGLGPFGDNDFAEAIR